MKYRRKTYKVFQVRVQGNPSELIGPGQMYF
jgi:hypothetical protein